MRRLIPLMVVTSFLGLACGDDGDPPIIDAPQQADANLDCSAPGVVVGMPCQLEDQSCGGPCTDQCSFCNLTVCRNGVWTQAEVFPALCFACGPEEDCVAGQSYCHVTHPDLAGDPDAFECVPIPDACSGDPTCECLAGEVTYDVCTGDTGQLFVETSGC